MNKIEKKILNSDEMFDVEAAESRVQMWVAVATIIAAILAVTTSWPAVSLVMFPLLGSSARASILGVKRRRIRVRQRALEKQRGSILPEGLMPTSDEDYDIARHLVESLDRRNVGNRIHIVENESGACHVVVHMTFAGARNLTELLTKVEP